MLIYFVHVQACIISLLIYTTATIKLRDGVHLHPNFNINGHFFRSQSRLSTRTCDDKHLSLFMTHLDHKKALVKFHLLFFWCYNAH